jgi:drug/metabolite transporter (DMT)-like permease
MVAATALALTAAVLHAGWNLVAKRSDDRFLALWGQFACAAVVGAIVLAATGGLPAAGWGWAAVTGLIHAPYIVLLARAYDRGDFAVAYPIARGGGALLAAIGGIVLLGDELHAWSVLAIVTVATGMAMLAIGAHRPQVAVALAVAATIGAYTVVDGHASRTVDADTYVFAVFCGAGLSMTVYGTLVGRGRAFVVSLATSWSQYATTAAMSVLTYGLVLAAMRRAAVGYVAALRESSVLVAAFVGWRVLSEGRAHQRLAAASVIVTGLVVLVAAT